MMDYILEALLVAWMLTWFGIYDVLIEVFQLKTIIILSSH